MNSKKVISIKNLPTRLPIQLTVLVYLLLDKFQPNDVTWGIVGTVVVLVWIGSVALMFQEKSVDIFETRVKE